MENATDALKMAAAVLIFVLALSISINAFGEARKTSQIIIENRDREYDYSYVFANGETQRTVGMETMIPTIYKAYKENYKIVFNFGNDNIYLYEQKKSNGETERISAIDMEKGVVLGSDAEKFLFIKVLLYGQSSLETDERKQLDKFKKLGITFNTESLYSIIKGKKFKEDLGIYYQEELQDKIQGDGGSNVPDANKTEKRVITYTMI